MFLGKNRFIFFETSAKESINVEQAFLALTRGMHIICIVAVVIAAFMVMC